LQTRTKNALTLAVAAAALAAGLVVLARQKGSPDLASHALDAIPTGALVVASADLDALRASPVGAPFLREGREIPGVGKVKDVCGFDPMDTLSEVALAIPAAGDAGEFGVVAAGKIDDEAILACAAKVIEARGGKAIVTPIGGFRTVRDSAQAGGGEIAVRKGGPLLLGAGSYLRAMIDAADGRAPSIRSSVAHTQLGKQIDGGAVRVTVVLSPEQRRSLVDELAIDGAKDSPAASVVAGAFGVKLGPRVALHGVIACEQADACARFATILKSARDAKANDYSIRLVGFGEVLEQLTIEPKGELIDLRVELAAEQAATLADRVLKLRGVSHPMPNPDDLMPPTAEPNTAGSSRPGPSASSSAAPRAGDGEVLHGDGKPRKQGAADADAGPPRR
jgi:hypothetical protein